jgi:predicted DNA-binding WGR domain protein
MAQKDFLMYVCQDDGHNKFWTYEITQNVSSGWDLVTRYGRIGQSGQTAKKTYDNKYVAEDVADRKAHEKLSKGYEPVDEDQWKILNVQASILGTGNKVEGLWYVGDHGGQLSELSTKELTNPATKPAIMSSFRLRNKEGATEPILVLITENAAYTFCAQQRRISVMGGQIHEEWLIQSDREKITKEHPLAEIVEKMQEVVGHTLFA